MHVTLSILIINKYITNLHHNSAVPGDPQDVKVTPINSTTIKVNWSPPLAKDRNGIILGYHVHIQETKDEVNIFVLKFQQILILFFSTGKKFLE